MDSTFHPPAFAYDKRIARVHRLVVAATAVLFAINLVWLFAALSMGDIRIGIVSLVGIALPVTIHFLTQARKTRLAAEVIAFGTLAYLLLLIWHQGISAPYTSAVHLWLLPLGFCSFLLFPDATLRRSMIHLTLCAGLFVIAELAVIQFPGRAPLPPDVLQVARSANWVLAMLLSAYFVRANLADTWEAEMEISVLNARLDQLIGEMLPKPVAERLRREGRSFADDISTCSVLVADITGFTAFCGSKAPRDVVQLLNDVFGTFDGIAASLGVDKIKTLGDAYVVASGVLDRNPNHAFRISRMAVEMRDTFNQRYSKDTGLRLRIGVDCGPVVAGVVGRKRYIYDLWGAAVDGAAEFETATPPGSIAISNAVREILGVHASCKPLPDKPGGWVLVDIEPE